MRDRCVSITEIKAKINDLLGQEISMVVNRGRRKIENYEGVISKVYPSVFTIKLNENDSLTYSYSDVLCGDVKIEKIN